MSVALTARRPVRWVSQAVGGMDPLRGFSPDRSSSTTAVSESGRSTPRAVSCAAAQQHGGRPTAFGFADSRWPG
ncbi:MAG: hypothetical protein EBS51_05220 [Planctomycetia bacterium]|nr:hypothetical protein [Planctomycetia bacterium]